MLTILIAGHNLHFIKNFVELFEQEGHTVLIDLWQGHYKHDETQSLTKLRNADLIICEWALGNSVWYSNNVKEDQRLFIRFHRQEIETDYPAKINFDSVEKIVFVSPFFQSKAIELFEIPMHKTTFIPNYVKTDDFSISKTKNAKFTIGMLGIIPQMKRFDLGLDILRNLQEHDSRYNLRVKGKLPKEYEWMVKRELEMNWYESQFSRIQTDNQLINKVHFDNWGDDVAKWFENIGFILSVSDFEGTHQAVAEGAVSGAFPMILKWPGADSIYPKSWCYNDAESITNSILSHSSRKSLRKKHAKQIIEKYDVKIIYHKWCELIGKIPTGVIND